MQICQKCRHVRQATETAPAWQCPACGVAYVKASATSEPQATLQRTVHDEPSSMSWTKAFAIVAIALGAWQGLQLATKRSGPNSLRANVSSQVSPAELASLAANVTADEVVIYTTTQCPYCATAKSWMTQNGFAFTECDAQVRDECARELDELGSDGVPYLIVRGHHLKEGFDTDQFVAALR